jgi:hypothetical protein
MMHVSIDPDTNVIKFKEDLNSLPCDENGYEVIEDFKVKDSDNNQTFYTDSNGLEMQKRVLNYWKTWDIQ